MAFEDGLHDFLAINKRYVGVWARTAPVRKFSKRGDYVGMVTAYVISDGHLKMSYVGKDPAQALLRWARDRKKWGLPAREADQWHLN